MTDDVAPHPRSAETLSLVEEFLNTLDLRTFPGANRGPHGTEELADPKALKRWLLARRLIVRGEEATEADVGRAQTLRAELRNALIRRDTPGAPPLSARALEHLHLCVRFDDSGDPLLEPVDQGRSVRAALATIASTVAIASIRGEWRRLRICAAPDCGWVFYDRSKPGTGRWCSMRVCGNRMKTRAYREAHAED